MQILNTPHETKSDLLIVNKIPPGPVFMNIVMNLLMRLINVEHFKMFAQKPWQRMSSVALLCKFSSLTHTKGYGGKTHYTDS